LRSSVSLFSGKRGRAYHTHLTFPFTWSAILSWRVLNVLVKEKGKIENYSNCSLRSVAIYLKLRRKKKKFAKVTQDIIRLLGSIAGAYAVGGSLAFLYFAYASQTGCLYCQQ
jgi:hypothetical protein